MSGVLAADAVRSIAVLFHNYLIKAEGHGVLRLEPPDLVSLPPLKVYTHVHATGKILVRELAGDDLASAGSVKKSKVQPKAKTKEQPAAMEDAALIEDDDDDEGDEEEDNDEEEEDETMRKEFELLDSLANARNPRLLPQKKECLDGQKKKQKKAPASSSSQLPVKKPQVQ